jgi:hypothetical protein
MQLHTAAFAFMEMKAKHTTWVKMTLSIEDMMETYPCSAALPVEGSGR